MVWISVLTIIVLAGTIYYYLHAQSEKKHRMEIAKFCSQSALKAANEDSWDPDKVKTMYGYLYSDCIRTH